MPQNPWDVPITPPQGAGQPLPAIAPAPAAPQAGLMDVLMQMFAKGTAQPPAQQGIVGGGQNATVLDPLQQAARQQQVQQTFASR